MDWTGAMDRDKQRKAEVEALSRMKDSAGIAVLMAELKRRVIESQRTVPLNESNWGLKSAHSRGYVDALEDLGIWIECRIGGHIDDEGRAVLARPKLSERKRRDEHGAA